METFLSLADDEAISDGEESNEETHPPRETDTDARTEAPTSLSPTVPPRDPIATTPTPPMKENPTRRRPMFPQRPSHFEESVKEMKKMMTRMKQMSMQRTPIKASKGAKAPNNKAYESKESYWYMG